MTLERAVAEALADYDQLTPDSHEVLAEIRTRIAADTPRSGRRTVPVLAAAAAVVVVALAAVSLGLRDPAPSTTPAGFGPATTRPPFQYTVPTNPGDLIPAARRQRAESLSIPLLSRDGSFRLAAHRGRVVVLTWTATWCGPCRTAYAATRKQSTQSSTTDLITIATKDDRTSAREFFRPSARALTAFDARGSSLTQLGNLPAALPLTVLIDRNQLVAAVYVSTVRSATLEASIEGLSRE